MFWRAVAILVLGGCAAPADPFYAWDDRNILCSDPIDDLTGTTPDWDAKEARVREAAANGWVTLVHAHDPGTTVSRDAIERVLGWVDTYHLDYVTYDELTRDETPRAGVGLAFDDNDIDGWLGIRDLLDAHHARATFFVTRWGKIGDAGRAGVAMLAADGHDIEPHSVAHLDAPDYVKAHGLDAYLADEVVPSIQALSDAGYHPTSYAYPFGDHDAALDDAILALPSIQRVRTTMSQCPRS